MEFIDTSYNVNTAGTVPTDIVSASTAPSSGPDSFTGWLKELGTTALGYGIEKDRAVTAASLRSLTPAPAPVYQRPDGSYAQPAGFQITPGVIGVGVLALVGLAVALKAVK